MANALHSESLLKTKSRLPAVGIGVNTVSKIPGLSLGAEAGRGPLKGFSVLPDFFLLTLPLPRTPLSTKGTATAPTDASQNSA